MKRRQNTKAVAAELKAIKTFCDRQVGLKSRLKIRGRESAHLSYWTPTGLLIAILEFQSGGAFGDKWKFGGMEPSGDDFWKIGTQATRR